VSFLSRLTAVLSKEDASWKSNSILVLDGASYHRTKEVRVLLKRLGVNFIISSPYSYDSAPIELLFSYFKREQLNPTHEPTGKK
jgi:transposase